MIADKPRDGRDGVYVIGMYKAAFRFVITDGRVSWSAPYGRRFIMGKTYQEVCRLGAVDWIADA